MLEAYLEKIAEATGAKSTKYQWVVVSVLSVVETDNGVTLSGRIRPMLTELGIPTLVPLE